MSDTLTPEVQETESGVNQEMIAAAAADLKEKNEKRIAKPGIRTFRRPGTASQVAVNELFPFPDDFDLSGLAPVSYLAMPEGEITGAIDTQEFSVIEERLKGLLFDIPGRNLARNGQLRTIKALKPNGTLAQLPFALQINNAAAGELRDALGLRKYQRRGYLIFMDFDTLSPVYCMARNCWAAAMVAALAKVYPEHLNVLGSGYCSHDHMGFTEPNLVRQGSGMFEAGATTSTSRFAQE